MRCGGFVSDFAGEVRAEELIAEKTGVAGLRLAWQGGGTFCGSPLGLPCGDDPSISFQVYVNRQLQGFTDGNQMTVHVEPSRQNWIEVIAIATHLRELPQAHVTLNTGGETALLSWPKSTDTDVEEYRIYTNGGSGAVNYASLYATVQAKPGGEYPTTGYEYRTGRLASGTHLFGIRAVDDAGNVQTSPIREDSCSVTRVPEPPGSLAYSYVLATKKVTLTWEEPTNWD